VTLATRRLIDASATLPAADRALLSLWTQRGLDDAAMAQMTGVDPATIAQRRARIVAELGTELGLPGEDVAAALSAIATSTASGNAGQAEIDPADPVLAAVSGPPATSFAALPSGPEAKLEGTRHSSRPRPEPESLPADDPARRRPVLWLVAALLGVAIVIVVLTAVPATSNRGGRPRTQAATSPGSAASPVAPRYGARTLGPLPGGISGASGSATVAAGSSGTQRLVVHVTGLPAVGSDHYEVWLYNSIIDSVPLGQLRPNGAGGFTLPAVVTRFGSIDISRQAPGSTEPSGASVLRAANPLAGLPH